MSCTQPACCACLWWCWCRGLYRSNTTWYHPEEVIPPQSYKDNDTGAFRTPFRYSKEMDAWEVQLVIPRRLAPVQLGFVLWFPGGRGMLQ